MRTNRAAVIEEFERLRRQVEWLCRIFLPEAAATEVARRLRPGIRLVPRPRQAGHDLELGACRIGGVPDLPASLPWPESEGQPLPFLAQLPLAEFVPFDLDGLLPSAGIAYVFYRSVTHVLGPMPAPWMTRKILFAEDVATLHRVWPPASLLAAEVYTGYALDPRIEVTLPPLYDLPARAFNEIVGGGSPLQGDQRPSPRWEALRTEVALLHGYERGRDPVYRLLGYAEPEFERRSEAQCLLQLESDRLPEDEAPFPTGMRWPETRSAIFWVSDASLKLGRLGDTWADTYRRGAPAAVFPPPPADPFSGNLEAQSRAVAAVCREAAGDIPLEMVEAFVRLLRPSIRLLPRRWVESEEEIGKTRIGGLPDLPLGMEWPVFRGYPEHPEDTRWEPFIGRPLPFLAQINLAEVHPFDVEHLLPEQGMLYFFFLDALNVFGFWPDYGDISAVIYVDETRPKLRRCERPVGLPEDEVYRGFSVVPRIEQTVPASDDLATPELSQEMIDDHLEFWDDIEAEIAAVQGFSQPDGVNSVPEHRLLGHPQLIQRFGVPEGERLLLQIDNDCCYAGNPHTGMEWGDAGTVYFWITPENLQAQNFGSARAYWECS